MFSQVSYSCNLTKHESSPLGTKSTDCLKIEMLDVEVLKVNQAEYVNGIIRRYSPYCTVRRVLLYLHY